MPVLPCCTLPFLRAARPKWYNVSLEKAKRAIVNVVKYGLETIKRPG